MRKYCLLIDCSYICKVPQIPISLDIYAGRLLQGFRNHTTFSVTALVVKGTEGYVDRLAGFEVDKIVVDLKDTVTHSVSIDRLIGIVPFEKELRDKKIDVVLTPCHVSCRYFFPERYHQHFIIHVFIYREGLKMKLGKWKYPLICLWRRILFSKVRHFISISEQTRKEALGYHIDSVVVHNSIPFDFHGQDEPISALINRKYILNVNRFESYKNHELLIRSFFVLKDKIPHCLYLKGIEDRKSNLPSLKSLVQKLNLADRVFFDTSSRSEGEMQWLYAHADLFVTPSLKEGFGWTPIEASVLGVPVLVSNIDVLKEVTCGRVPTFDPFSPEDLANKMYAVLSNPPTKKELEELSALYRERYSLGRQITQIEELLLYLLYELSSC